MRDIYWVCRPVQRAVYSILAHYVGVARLDVDIRSPALQRIENDGVDQLDDRRHLLIARQPVHVQVFFTVLGFDQQRQLVGPETRRRILEDPGGGIAALENLFDGGPGGDRDFDPHANLGAYLVQRIQIGRISDRDEQCGLVPPEWHEVVAQHQIDRQLMYCMVIDLSFRQVNVLEPVPSSQVLCLSFLQPSGRIARRPGHGDRFAARDCRPISLLDHFWHRLSPAANLNASTPSPYRLSYRTMASTLPAKSS